MTKGAKHKKKEDAPVNKEDDIDAIFSQLPKKKREREPQVVDDTQKASKQKLDDHNQDGFFDSRGDGGKRKRTEEGYPIYTEEELRIGQGGDTPLCPFDCDCCF
eukprot:c17976_g1_i1.p1 GENE.c17976_g1_i1~~c17976_g1_i1.p1  ORF type:complete len:104 (+),score=22.12 c17976_g1_i1:36-347(+)